MVMLSRFGAPPADVATVLIVLLPATSGALKVAVVQSSQVPVELNDVAEATVVPLTMMSIGRSAVVPLEYRMVTGTVPASSAGTVHCSKAPTALVVLQKPVPVKPAWSASIVPSQVPFSASKTSPGGGVVP